MNDIGVHSFLVEPDRTMGRVRRSDRIGGIEYWRREGYAVEGTLSDAVAARRLTAPVSTGPGRGDRLAELIAFEREFCPFMTSTWSSKLGWGRSG